MPTVRTGGVAVVLLVLLLLAASCARGNPAGTAGQATRRGVPPATAASPGDMRMLGSAYLAIAGPANHRLETEVNGFTRHQQADLAAAEADLRAEAATEQRFDRLLSKIPFPPRIAVTARALVQANQRRAALAGRQARSSSVSGLLSFARRHQAADAAVEAQVKIIRRALGLPPPHAS
jgi:hypothetical protein